MTMIDLYALPEFAVGRWRRALKLIAYCDDA